MCDTLCAIGGGGTVFGKNSDRPPGEVQVVESFGRRPAGGLVKAQYLDLDDPGAQAVLGSRPSWLWGFEHGVSERGVAIGNERVYTVDDPSAEPDGLIGMDLVRLALEGAQNAEDALSIMTALLERYGQGGVAEAEASDAYHSSFLIADATAAWVLETSGRTWAAKAVDSTAAISNRISLTTDWDRASDTVTRGQSFDAWRDPAAPTGHADVRLAAARTCLAPGPDAVTPRRMAAHLRHHGERAWGEPGADPADVSLPPDADVSVCMHVRGIVNTTSSMIAELPAEGGSPVRAWAALGSPCAGIFVPLFPPDGVPSELADPVVWRRFADLRDRVEANPGELVAIREVFGPLEADLWDEADVAANDASVRETFVRGLWARVEDALGHV